MAKQIARLLKTNVMADIDVPAIAQFLQAQGQRGDSILAHINPKEAALLQKMGGAGTPNPVTGLPEFYSIDPDYAYGADYAPTASKQYIDTSGFEGVGQEFLGDFAAQQYANSAFPYELEGDNAEIGPYVDGKRIREFPGGMSATPYLSPASQAGRAPSYFDTTLEGIDAQQNLDRARNAIVGRIDAGKMPTLAPEITGAQGLSRAAYSDVVGKALDTAAREYALEPPPATGVNRIAQALGLSGSDLARLGLAGLGVYQGVRASREAAEAGREARREQEALAQPYREQGQQLVAQAQRGELTAPAQQQLAALRARSAQAAAARGGGGAGAAQAEAQIEAFRQQLLQNQYDYGMKVSNIGDQIALGAIRTGLEADRYASTLANNYFQNMARVAVGMPGEGGR